MAPRIRKSTPYPSGDGTPQRPLIIEGTFIEHPPQREHDPQFHAMYGHEHPNPAYAELRTGEALAWESPAPQPTSDTTHEPPELPVAESPDATPSALDQEDFTPHLRAHRGLVPRQFRRLLDATMASTVESPLPTEVDGSLPSITQRLIRGIGATTANDIAAAHAALNEEIQHTRALLDNTITPTDADSDLLIFRQAQHRHRRPWEEDDLLSS